MVTIIKKGMKKKQINLILDRKKKSKKKKLDIEKYCGILKLTEDPSAIQEKLRNEW
ncbi:MAG: hypothetical protein KDC90_16520 [Ignavibacteriae bacterium]|nr:hypothetical protein [Ignavibacteriota bacterium]MCB9211152.1 hypothetical protein [Ignavibacteriales bacterium]